MTLLIFTFVVSLAAVTSIAGDLMARRTPDYDYVVPRAGEYTLPILQEAADGAVLGAKAASTRLHEVMRDRIVVLSFIYTRCNDPKACIRATTALNELQRISAERPELAKKLLLVTLSFDPVHDTPNVMDRYGRVAVGKGDGAEWLFLTTKDQAALEPLLKAYGQRVDRRKDADSSAPFYHPLRVYLIDSKQKVRNIYSYGLLDPRLVATDALTLLSEK